MLAFGGMGLLVFPHLFPHRLDHAPNNDLDRPAGALAERPSTLGNSENCARKPRFQLLQLIVMQPGRRLRLVTTVR